MGLSLIGNTVLCPEPDTLLPMLLLQNAGLVLDPVPPVSYLSATLLGFPVCIICNYKSFHSFIFKLCIDIEGVHLLFCANLIIIFSFFSTLNA